MSALPTLYKLLNADGTPANGGKGRPWSLPTSNADGTWAPGKWRTIPARSTLVPCKVGLHLTDARQLLQWSAPALFVAETEGEVIARPDKWVARKARLLHPVEAWNERTLRLFAADCAERVLSIFEARYPNDARPRHAIEVARLFADGKATREELSAASYAASSAAFYAAYSDAASYAASSAAFSSAYSDAASAAEEAAEREWQTLRLLERLGIAV